MARPRYFVPRSGSPRPWAPGPVEHPLDVLVLGGQEWLVGLDRQKTLTAQPLPAELAPEAARQLAFHEVSGGGRRRLGVDEIHLFAAQVLAQAPDCPGTDDPVHLYGTLVGPIGTGSLGREAVEGQLTVSRGDVLEAMVQGAGEGFRQDGGLDGSIATTFNLLLPAGRPEDIHAGQSLVLAYPLGALELYGENPGNEELVCQMLHDVLEALWSDAGTPRALPTPNRAALVARLQQEGFTVEGDEAARKKGGIIGRFLQEKRPLPPQGTVADYVRLAGEALGALPAWPPPRAAALRARRSPDGSPRPAAPPPETFVRPPRVPAAPPSTPTWVQDFEQQSARLTPAPSQPSSWMQDFQPQRPEPEKAADKRPDWMDDFKR